MAVSCLLLNPIFPLLTIRKIRKSVRWDGITSEVMILTVSADSSY
jgi:hypothetical protein